MLLYNCIWLLKVAFAKISKVLLVFVPMMVLPRRRVLPLAIRPPVTLTELGALDVNRVFAELTVRL